MHAALVHFPVSAWTGASLLELSRPLHGKPTLAGIDVQAASIALTWIGLCSAGVAAIAGLVQLARLPADSAAAKTGDRHMLATGTASVCYLLLALSHPSVGAFPIPAGIAWLLWLGGLLLLLVGGHLGGRLTVEQYTAGQGQHTSSS